jgi:putative oxidoreductase
MADLMSFYSRWTPRLLSVLRIVAALLIMEHGTQKLFNFPPAPQGGAVALASLFGVAAVLEFFGGLLILLGLFTRPVAFILAGEMAVAYFKVHAPQGLWPILNKGELAALYCFIFLYLSTAGGGTWSVDSIWRGRGASQR